MITIAQGSDGNLFYLYARSITDVASQDSKRSSPSLLARQLRLRLVADDDSDIPRNLQNMVVSIHAIATFQALNDYLRPRVAGSSSGRMTNMLATLAASGFGPGTTSRIPPDHEASQPTIAPPSSSDAPPNEVRRRRSQRLSVKNGTPGSSEPIPDNAWLATTGLASALDSIPRREEPLVQESDLAAELTDDEVDAEVGSLPK